MASWAKSDRVRLIWSDLSWNQYVSWQAMDKAVIKKINALIRDINRDPYSGDGIGKPELLRGNMAGWASRRITDGHRLVYRVREEGIEILSCYGHYQ